jgi:hypothetical protein
MSQAMEISTPPHPQCPVAQFHELHGLLGLQVRHLRDVGARHEGLVARARQDDRLDGIVLRTDRHCRIEFVHGGVIHRVERFGPIEGNNGHAVFNCVNKVCKFHWVCPSF